MQRRYTGAASAHIASFSTVDVAVHVSQNGERNSAEQKDGEECDLELYYVSEEHANSLLFFVAYVSVPSLLFLGHLRYLMP
jgi:hypothetical protein